LILSNDVSQQLFIAGCLEPNEMAFLDRFLKPGMKVIDIGANEGCYSVLCGAKVGENGKVWAFEPSPREFAVLKANAEQNPKLNIACFPVAIGNKNGTVKLRIAEGIHAGQNTLGEFSYSITELDFAIVSIRRLDDLIFEAKTDRIDLIKIDVEGAEGLVLEGARRTLETFRPVVLL
jgi:FkbM family methyltransferase